MKEGGALDARVTRKDPFATRGPEDDLVEGDDDEQEAQGAEEEKDERVRKNIFTISKNFHGFDVKK